MVTAELQVEVPSRPHWRQRLAADRRRAAAQPHAHRSASRAIVERATADGADAVIITGSTVRDCRHETSDLDFLVVGVRPQLDALQIDVDVCAIGAERFWTRLRDGDDYLLWTLRFGWVLHDEGILAEAMDHVEKERIAPSAERKLVQAQRSLRLAALVLASDDLDGAREQCRAALTTVARWRLITAGIFPFARPELPAQLLELDEPTLAGALQATIEGAPSAQQLGEALAHATGLTAAAARSRRSPSSAGS
jgi:hypothetical protein